MFSPIRSEGNSTELFVDGPDTFNMLLQEIEKAKHFIHVQVMLFYSDKAGIRIAEALAKKANEGVKVRVMSDSELSAIVRSVEKVRSSGSSDFSNIKAIFSKAGVKFLSSDDESYRFDAWPQKRKKFKEQGVPEKFLEMQDLVQEGIKTNLNVFDHRKILVFDGISAVITGSNLAEKYLYAEDVDAGSEAYKWHSGAVLIKGPFASIANRLFSSKWMVRGGDIFDPEEHFRDLGQYGEDICTAYSSFPGLKQNYIRDWYLEKLKTCEGDLIIQNPYINDEQFWKVLGDLPEGQAKKIKLVNPYKARGNDYIQNESSIKCRAYDPVKKGISFYAYQWRMTHWKIALDVQARQVMVGSYNLNHRSAYHDFEMNVLVESKSFSAKVEQMLATDMKQSQKISDPEEFYKNPILHSSCLLLEATEYFE